MQLTEVLKGRVLRDFVPLRWSIEQAVGDAFLVLEFQQVGELDKTFEVRVSMKEVDKFLQEAFRIL